MNIELHEIEKSTIEDFAERHGLTMVVRERHKPIDKHDRYYAFFKNAEVKNNAFIISLFGNGQTPEEAIEEYSKFISLRTLIFDAKTDGRREIEVPNLMTK